VAKGYWRNEEATRESFLPDGWFLTGDIGFLDEDGVLYVTDRKKDMIVMSGFKIYPAEVESILLQNPKILERRSSPGTMRGGGRSPWPPSC
jgi:Acyl-CoA synthetases (AMP-forming)/AMP-acid ligases II